MLIVSGVGTLIVAYSIGYMYGDQKERRFFVYLNLFLFSMLLLVMSANFALLLAGWGLVGLSSYLLIGFWHERKAPVDAAKKAFVMNAIGDVGLAIVVFIMVRDLGTVQFQAVFDQAGARWAQGSETANWIAFLLLVAAVAKSAQIPLHTWLPDAMEGPTPVSALIHAATMVTAGVYLVARTHLLFENAPDIHDLVALIGVATLLMAGAIAVVQTDIKRIIAYSTMSQIGYMFAAVGVGAYSSGMDHLADPRLLQGPALPRRRHRDPRPERRAGRAPDGRAPQRPSRARRASCGSGRSRSSGSGPPRRTASWRPTTRRAERSR